MPSKLRSEAWWICPQMTPSAPRRRASVGHRLLEGADEGDGLLDAILEIGGQRPVARAQMAAHPIERLIEPQRELVAAVAEKASQLAPCARPRRTRRRASRGSAGLSPSSCTMSRCDLDAAEAQAGIVAQALVVVAGDQHDPRALAGLAHAASAPRRCGSAASAARAAPSRSRRCRRRGRWCRPRMPAGNRAAARPGPRACRGGCRR